MEETLTKVHRKETGESLFWSVAMDEKTRTRYSDKVIETKEELLIYTSFFYYKKVFSPKTQDAVREFISLLNFLIRKGVKIKVLVGGIFEEMQRSGELKSLSPVFTFAHNIDTRYTDLITNNFEILDGEKVLLKILNLIDLKENLALIYI